MDVWILMQHWTTLDVSGTKPPSRSSNGSFSLLGSDNRPLLMVVGGLGNDAEFFSDIWQLDIDNGVWTEVSNMVVKIKYAHVLNLC